MPQATDIIKNPVKRDGVSQKQRRLPALDPAFVKIDERTLEDFLVFTLEYSEKICFFDLNNKEAGNWKSFWGCDPTLIIAAIVKTNPLPAKKACEAILDGNPSVTGLHDLVQSILQLARKIDDWYDNLTAGTSLHLEVKRLILANLDGLLEQLAMFEKGAVILFGEDYPGVAEAGYDRFSKEWGFSLQDLQTTAADLSLYRPSVPINEENPFRCFEDLTREERLTAAYPRLKELFTKIYNICFQIIQIAPLHFQESLKRKDHPPHLTLFITFLMLYQQVQEDLNRMTGLHLDFYYKEVLGLKEKEAEPDKVHLFFELAKNLVEHQLDGGVRFKAGKDDLGNDLFFSLDKNGVFNTAKVESLRTVFLRTSGEGLGKKILGIHAAPVANSAGGNGEEIKDEENPSWPTLGNAGTPEAETGFVIASHELLLAGGFRKITLDVYTESPVELPVITNLNDPNHPFGISLSGEKAWIEPGCKINTGASLPSPGFRLHIELDEAQPAVVPYNAETYKQELGTDLPVLKVKLSNKNRPPGDSGIHFYELLRKAVISKIVLSTEVTGAPRVLAFNDEGAVDTGKPFLPFTGIPKKGSSLYVGNAEAFRKGLDWVRLNLHWEQVPNNFGTHYAGYNTGKVDGAGNEAAIVYTDFKAAFYSIGSIEYDLETEQEIFKEPPAGSNADDSSDRKTELTVEHSEDGPLAYLLSADKVETYGQEDREGFIRLDLTRDFEHDQFQQVLTRQMLAVSRYDKKVIGAYYWTGGKPVKASDAATTTDEVVIPKNPYTPSLKTITLDYRSSADTSSTADADVITFLHLHPFSGTWQKFDASAGKPLLPQFAGRVKQFPVGGPANSPVLIPESTGKAVTVKSTEGTAAEALIQDNAISVSETGTGEVNLLEEGALFIGLSGLQPRQSLSLLFQVAENTADADMPKAKVRWYYLSGNEWIPFEEFQVLSDTTDELLTSGIVEFTMPDGINKDNTILPADFHWIKAAVSDHSASVSECINVHAQAARATFQDNENDLSRLANPLPAETISKLENDDAGVKTIVQPYDSFGGLPAEDPLSFYTRVSERLRHKGRAITQYDYERLILEAFPSIYKVKCVNHTTADHLLCPGHVLVSVVPDFTKLKAVDRMRPKVTLAQLEKIKRFLEERNSCFVDGTAATLHVMNPRYETINLDFEVQFRPEVTAIDFHIRKLKDAILRYLTPWAYDDAAEINFGGKVFKSSILHFVEKQSYVDYVVNFKMMHDESTLDTNIIEAKTPRSILVPVAQEKMNIRHTPPGGHCPGENKIQKTALGYQALHETELGK